MLSALSSIDQFKLTNMNNLTPNPSPPRKQQPPLRDQEERSLSNRLIQLTQQQQRSASKEEQRRSASRTSGKASLQNTILVQSSLVGPVPQRQVRPQSLSNNHQYAQIPNYPQPYVINNQRPFPFNQQFQPQTPTHPQNNFSANQPPNWTNQPQSTQARLQPGRRPTFSADQIQPQHMIQSQRAIDLNQINLRRVNIPSVAPSQTHNQPSPNKVLFNYNPNPSVANSHLAPQPTMQLLAQSTTSTLKVPPAPIIINKPAVTEPIIWQQRYLTLLEMFEFYYSKLDIITRSYAYLQTNIEKTQAFSEPNSNLKQQSRDLLNIIIQTEQQLKELIDTNKHVIAQAVNWKNKYEGLKAQADKKYQQHQEDCNSKHQEKQEQLREAKKQNQLLRQSTEALTDHYLIAQQENQELKLKIRDMEDRAHEAKNNDKFHEDELREYEETLQAKNQEINELKNTIQQLSKSISANVNARMTANHNLKVSVDLDQYKDDQERTIANLKQENKSLSAQIEDNNKKYQQSISKVNQQISNYQAELTHCHQEAQHKSKQIQQLSKNLAQNHAQATSTDSQTQIRKLKHQIRLKQQTHQADAKIFHARVQQLTDKLKALSLERDSLGVSSRQTISLLQSDLSKKDATIRNLRDRILQLEEEKRIKDLDMKYSGKKSDNSRDPSSEVNSLKREISEKINQIEDLQAQIAEYKRITNEYQDSLNVKAHEINNLRRQLDSNSSSQDHINKLTDLLNSKNLEIIDLKSVSFELEKVKNENEQQRKEINSLKESLKRKQEELTDYSDKIYVLEHEVREVEMSKDKQASIKLEQEKALLHEAIHKKDQEIVKLRQTNQLLQTNVEAVEAELDKLRSKLSSGEQLSESVNFDLRNKLKATEKQLLEHQLKIAGLEEVKAILQQQVTTLTTQVHLKLQNAQNFESQLRQERIRTKALQTELQSLASQVEQLRVRSKQTQKKAQILQKQLQSQTQKNKELTHTKKNELSLLNSKYIELQKAAKSKDTQIKQLQKTVQTLNYKIKHFDNNIEEMEYLKHKITQYEVKTNMFSVQRYSRSTDLQPTQVFERKVIYKLKMENDALKKELGLTSNRKNHAELNANIPERDNSEQYLKDRLNNFNQRLEDIIGQQFSGQLPDISEELYKQFEKDKLQLIDKHNAEIRQLRTIIQQLEQQNLFQTQSQVSVLPQQAFVMPGLEKRGKKMLDNVYYQQVQFYRQKNQELQERVDEHIRVNRELKQSITELMRNHAEGHSIEYYRQQLQKNNETIASLQNKLKKTNEELRKNKEESARSNSRITVHDNYSLQTEAKTNELNRKIHQLTLELNEALQDRANHAELTEEHERQKKKLKINIEQLKRLREQISRQAAQKQNELEQQIIRLNTKLRAKDAQILTYTETHSKKKGEHSKELQEASSRIAQLQETNSQYKLKLEQSIINLQKSQRELLRWQNQNKSLVSQLQRFKDSTDSLTKKNKQYETELQNTRVQVSELQSQLRFKESKVEALTLKEAQFRDQTVKASNQLRLMQAEIDRINEFNQRKIAEKQSIIVKYKDATDDLRQKINDLQQRLEQVRIIAYRHSGSSELIQDLREETNQLKAALAIKNNELNDRLRQIQQLQKSLQTAEYQFKQLKKKNDSKFYEMNLAVSQLQDQNRNLKKSSQATIEQLNARNESLRQNNSELSSIITQLQEQINEFQSEQLDLSNRLYQLQQELRNTKENAESQILELQSDKCLLQNQLRQLKYSSGKITEITSSITISELNITILQLKQQLKATKDKADQTTHSLQLTISQLQDQLRQARHKLDATQRKDKSSNQLLDSKQHEINSLSVRIIILESQLRELTNVKDAQIQQLRQQLLYKPKDAPTTSQALRKSRYLVQFMRSTLLQVQALISEDSLPREYLYSKVRQQVQKSMDQCQKWSETQ